MYELIISEKPQAAEKIAKVSDAVEYIDKEAAAA